MPRWNRKA